MTSLFDAPRRFVIDDDRRMLAQRAVAASALVIIGARQFVHTGLTSGYVLAILLAPVWIGVLHRFVLARLLLLVGLAAAASGYALSRYALGSHEVVPALRSSSLSLVLGTLCAVGTVLWARSLMSRHTIGLLFGLGIVLSGYVDHLPAQGNPWKFLLAIPVGMIVLSLVRLRGGGKGWELAALLVLAATSAALDSRSYFGTFLLAALLVLWQMRPRISRSAGSVSSTVVLMAGIGAAMYYLATSLLVNGYLGKDAQARSVEQITTSGSLLLGGRPELKASLALFQHDPLGFGFGVIANPNEVLVAKSGLASINYSPNNGYVDRFMFGSQVELHSMVGDLWAQCGIAGLALVLAIVVVVVVGLAQRIATRTADGLSLFLGIWTLWNVLFSPLYASAPTLTVALGVLLLTRRTRREPAEQPDPALSGAAVLVEASAGRSHQ